MPKYPTNLNDPTLTVNNVTLHYELDSNPSVTDTMGDLTTALSQLSTEITAYNSAVSNGGFTNPEKKYATELHAIKMAHLQAVAMNMSFHLKRLTAQLTLVNTNGVPTTSRYPSSKNRGY